MKKTDLKSLALMGITGGLMLSSQGGAAEQSTEISYSQYLAQNSCTGAGGCAGKGNGGGNGKHAMQQNSGMSQSDEMMSEGRLFQKVDARHRAMYNRMSPEGKQLARKLAGQSCAGHNECKGLNSCKTDKNACAGKGACKGQSKCSFKDKNQAVEVANSHMLEKRTSMIQNPQSNRNPYQNNGQSSYRNRGY